MSVVALKKSSIPKGSVSASPTFFGPLKGVTLSRVSFDPKNADIEYDYFNQSPEEKLNRMSREDHSISYAVWVKTRGADQKFYIKLTTPDGKSISKDDKIIRKLVSTLKMNDPKKQTKGFSYNISFKSLVAQLIRQCVVRGGVMLEAVVDAKRQPSHLKALDTAHIEWKEVAEHEFKPYQRFKEQGTGIAYRQVDGINGRSLDYPNIFYGRLDGSPDHPYPDSPMLPVLAVYHMRRVFFNDMKEVVKKTAWPRFSLKIMSELLTKAMPHHIRGNPKLHRGWVDEQMAMYVNQFRQLQPGQALIHEDYLVPGIIESKAGTGKTLDAAPMIDVLEKMIAQSTKTYDTILGQKGSIDPLQVFIEGQGLKGYQGPVSDVLSGALTFYLRVMGVNALATFSFAPFDMRPESELSAYKSLQQKTNLINLALGVIDEDDYSISTVGQPQTDSSILAELKGNRDFLDKLLGIDEDVPENSDTDSPNSPGKGPNNPDDRSDPEANRKRGVPSSNKKSGGVKSTSNSKSRKPRAK